MITHDSSVRVRYGEVDMMGYLYHSHYVELFDLGRNDLLRSLGYTYRELEESGVMMPVLRVEIDYRKPANYDDLLTVRTTLRELPTGARVTFHYEVFRPAPESPMTTEKLDLSTPQTEGSVTNLSFSAAENKALAAPLNGAVLPAGELLTTGAVTLAFMDSITHRPMRPPGHLVELFAPHFTQSEE